MNHDSRTIETRPAAEGPGEPEGTAPRPRRRLRRHILPVTLALLLSMQPFLLGCSDDDDDEQLEDQPFPHSIPSTATMEVDVSGITSTGVGNGREEGACHALAALIATATNVQVIVRLAIPVATFAACAQADPVFLGDGTWRWTADGGTGQNAWTAELTGVVVSDERIDWTMRIDGTALDLEDFVWYDGYADPEARDGEWRYYDPQSPDEPRQQIECTWSAAAEDDRSLAFGNTDETTSGFGDVLIYSLDGNIAAISFYDASDEATSEISWDRTTGEGTFEAPDQTCCWGPKPDFDDMECP